MIAAEAISIKERSPLEFALLARGGRQAQTALPPGVYFRRKARNNGRGNRFGQSLKEFFLVVCGDPLLSAPWLAQQIKKLETQGFDARRQRAGARFDSNHGPLLVPLARPFQDSLQGFPTRPPELDSCSRSRSRSRDRLPRGRPSCKVGMLPLDFTDVEEKPRPSRKKTLIQEGTAEPAREASQDFQQGSSQPGISDHDISQASSWQLFLRAAQDGLSNCRSCLSWESSPHNLADTLASVEDWLGLLNPDEPPAEASAPWHDSERLQEVLFCVSSYHREDQLKKTLALNLACLAPYRKHVQVALVTFGPDADLQHWAQTSLRWAVEQRLLRLASSGTAPEQLAEDGCWRERPGKQFSSWHAAVAKNTSHVAALKGTSYDLAKTLLVNLDNDNLLGICYLGATAEAALACLDTWHGRACPAVTCGTGSLTGRLAYWALDFAAVGGYDEETGSSPSGQVRAFVGCMRFVIDVV